jgi:hypothetical protein
MAVVSVSNDLPEGDGASAEQERRSNHDEADGLVEDDGFQSGEAKLADQQREPELRAPQPDQPAQRADDSAGAKRSGVTPVNRDTIIVHCFRKFVAPFLWLGLTPV